MTLFIRLRDAVKDMLRKADMVLLAMCLIAAAYGILLIASASGYLGHSAQIRNIIIQSAGTLLGIGIYFVFSNIDVEHFSEKWVLFLLFNLGFIALLKTPLGVDVRGNVAWLAIPHFPVNIQPAEIVKLTYTVLLARQIAWFRDNRRMRGLWSLVLPAAHAAFMFVWIYVISKDAGSALVYLIIYAGMALAAGLPWYWFAAGGGALCALGVAAIAMLDKLPPYWVSRFRVIFDHSYDIQGAGYQQRYSMLAIGSGGLFGQGLFQGIQTHAAVGLPDRQNDFIFAVCGEELGRPSGQELHGGPHLRGLRLHADLPDPGEHRHVPLCHAGHRPDAALFQLRGQLHCHSLRRHGNGLRRAEQNAARLAEKDIAACGGSRKEPLPL